MAVWTYLAHDLRSNERLGSLPLGGVRLVERLDGYQTLEATVDLAGRTAARRVVTSEIPAGWTEILPDLFDSADPLWSELGSGSELYEWTG